MKKTLNNIFDEAAASEIESLVNQNSAPDVSADTLFSIKNKVYAKTGIAKTESKKPFIFRWQSYAAVAACLLIIVGGIISAPSIMKLFNDVEPSDIVDQELPTDIDNIFWASDSQSEIAPDDVAASVEWNGWLMNYSLYEALNSADTTDFIAVHVSKNNSADLDSFEYNGTTYSDLQAKQDDLRTLTNKLTELRKEGEWLKHGDLLYTTGTPDGEKWAKSLYDERVAFYGEDFIAKYIVDSKVQQEALNEDYIAFEKQIEELSKEASELIKAYHESYVNDVEDIFVRSGACTIVRNGSVFLFVQKDELANLKIDGKKDYMLSLARRSAFEGSITEIPAVDNTITGFAIDKIRFDGTNTEVKTDADVAAAIQSLINNNEILQFIIYSDVHLTEEDLDDMHYTSFDQWNYPTRTVVSVKIENINMEAVKNLTNRSDVDSVHIGAPYIPLPDDVVDEPEAED